MNNTRTTKRALMGSALSVLLCFSMLVGSTFAWFTDQKSTSVNQIQSGTLEIDLVDANGKSLAGETLKFNDKDENAFWEPGCTYALDDIFILNKGNLAVKYEINITGINGDAKLNEAIEWTITGTENGELMPDTKSGAISISGHMKEGAGNEYQGLSIDGISITVFATQLNKESDSTGPDYDKNAPILITVNGDSTTYATIGEAFAATGETTFNVSGPIDMSALGNLFQTKNQNVTFNQMKGYPEAYYDFSNTVIDANGANITINGGYIQGKPSNTGNGFGFQHTTGTITYKGVTINDSWTNENGATVKYDGCTFTGTYYIWTYGAPNITFNSCTFDKTDSRAILVYSHGVNYANTVTITDCTFKADAKGYTGVPAWTAAVEVDASGISAGATVNITNCTADNNYNGIVRDKAGVNATITVDGAAVVSNQDAFAQAIAEKKTNITLGAGNYTMAATDSDVIISGTKDAVLTLPEGVRGNNNTITFKDITIVGADDDSFYTTQLSGAKMAVYENCTIKGLISTYCNSNFKGCVFENTFADQYSVFCYGAPECNFTDCTFNTACSKAIKLYNESTGEATLNVTNCKFFAAAKDKAAVEIDSTYTSKYVVNISNCTINENYSKLWNDKSTKSVVTVNGTVEENS